MSTDNKTKPTIVLAAVEDATAGPAIVDAAADVARGARRGELHVLHVIPHWPEPSRDAKRAVEQYVALADNLVARARGRGLEGRVFAHGRAGDPARAIVQMASDVDADLIVVGTHGRSGIARLALGSVSEAVARTAGCAVLVVRAKDHENLRAPGIEPPCSDCVEARKASNGATMWCERHAQHHAAARTHYEVPPTFAMGSLLLRP